jgi:hypothetical protein
MLSGGLHFHGPEPDVIAATAVASAVAVWGPPTLSWTMPANEFERELLARDGQCVVLTDFDAASPEQVSAALMAISAARVSVVSWGVGTIAAKAGALDLVVIDVPVPRMKETASPMIDWMAKAHRRMRIADTMGGSTPMNAFDQFLADTREELAAERLLRRNERKSQCSSSLKLPARPSADATPSTPTAPPAKT